jgi:hypothetical protein
MLHFGKQQETLSFLFYRTLRKPARPFFFYPAKKPEEYHLTGRVPQVRPGVPGKKW